MASCRLGTLGLLTLGLLLVSSAHPLAAQPSENATPPDRPNVIVILADDLGYGDLGAYGQRKIRTPHIDRMAEEGTRFTQFYAGSTVCAPSRWSLLNGVHMGHAHVRGNGGPPLRPEDRTITHLFQDAGYATGMFGKWGLGAEGTSGAPQKQGFDAFLGYLRHVDAHDYYPDSLWTLRDGQLVARTLDPGTYSHDLLADEALAFIEAHRDEPFFLYLPFTIPHAELAVPASSKAAYLSEDGTSLLRPDMPFPCCGVIGTYDAQEHPHAAFAGMVSRMDRDVGRILDTLRALGLDDNTVVLLTSDNGPHVEGGADPGFFDSNGPFRGLKRDLYEGGIRVPMIAWGPGTVPANQVSDHVWAMWDLLPTLTGLAGLPDPDARRRDGLSMQEALTGGDPPEHEYLYWEFHHGWVPHYIQAIRQGPWKALRFTEPSGATRLELFNLEADRAETYNVATEHPEVARRLDALIDRARTAPELERFRNPYANRSEDQ
jgi:arylsulfatase A-like enzyme